MEARVSTVNQTSETKATDGDRTRAAILEAAEALFVDQGYAATSMASIAKRAGVTKSLIHHHFGSKEELWSAVKWAIMAEYGEQQMQLLQGREPDLQLLEDSIVVYFRFLQRNPKVVKLWSWMVIDSDEVCASATSELTQAGVEVMRAGQARGFIRTDVQPEYVLAQFFSLVRGWFMERGVLQTCGVLNVPNDLADDRYLRAVLKVYLDGLRPQDTPASGT